MRDLEVLWLGISGSESESELELGDSEDTSLPDMLATQAILRKLQRRSRSLGSEVDSTVQNNIARTQAC